MDSLEEKFKEAFSWYAGSGGHLSHMYVLHDPVKNVYALNSVDDSPRKYPALIVLMARLDGDHIIIEADNTDKPLADRLEALGVPRDRIIKYYAGEPLPDGLKQPADFSIS